MRPSELKSLKGFLAAIGEEIASFRNVFKDGATSISDQNKANQQSQEYQREQILHAIDDLTNQKNQSDGTSEANQNRRHRQNLWVQWTLAGVTFLAFTAAAIYAGFAYFTLREAQKQTTAAQKTMCEIQKQTTLMRQETIGNQGAVLTFLPVISVPAIAPDIKALPGRVPAKNVHVEMTVQRITLPEQSPIGKSIRCEFQDPQLSSGGGRVCYMPDFTSDSMNEIMHTRQSVTIKGTFSYGNGFDETSHQDFCLTYLGYRFSGFIRGDKTHPTSGEDDSFHDCADFDGALRRALDFKKKYGDSYVSEDAP
jgi:hypothetical protein